MPNQPTNRPGMPMTLVASAARTTSSNSGNLKDTTTPWPTSDNYSICLNVTAYSYAPGTTGAQGFDVYIDQLLGDGTTWVRAQKFATITTSTADRKSTRLNSSHQIISYAVFCLKKKNLPPHVLRDREHPGHSG